MTSSPADPQRQGRRRAALIGLLLLGWGLGLGPLAHAVLAHGEPLLRESSDLSWVQHARSASTPSQDAPLPHHHAPGGLEHLQLALVAIAVALALTLVLLQVPTERRNAWRAPLLARWWLPAVPGAP